jgi:hypothetical protein
MSCEVKTTAKPMQKERKKFVVKEEHFNNFMEKQSGHERILFSIKKNQGEL